MNTSPISIYEPVFDQDEIDAVVACMAPDRFNSNRPIEEFEQAFSARCGFGRAIAVGNGSVALHLAMLAAGLGPGDEVIVPALTFVATANAVRYVGATPVFADVDPLTWQMGAQQARPLISKRTRAIVPVHLYGHASPVTELRRLAEEHNLLVIEDCAEALGTTVDGEPAGLHADAAVFSFYKNKTITTGEGGVVLSRHADWHDRMVLLKGQGVPLDRRFWHEVVGYNYRMTNLAAAVGTAQLNKLERFVERKRAILQRYRAALADVLAFQEDIPGSQSSGWLVSAAVPQASQRDPLMAFLGERGIQTRPVFLPLQRFPMYAQGAMPTPNAEAISARGLSLPSWPGLDDAQIDRVSATIKEFFK
ncbi:DegT/DnrJ/EryC1/StrS family aminotransferase [Herbaspirillum sp. WKF16]|uniref:DegT/DnrJ/EryC1/StrS family aminotransferase n=1 Tax=Herbaspirillum sp. WKF16 TaxID=3028312 RepID=UPI0023A9B5ED|nr:DegT/DnrJ/EryC1/StrS family aminotransferase [Herbaspirillum sp. WKF16]WDZ95748.1 DegT/DnrJ/EryC1/StrS family aminotransferase [Herbaspirillum sp. WKF16]